MSSGRTLRLDGTLRREPSTRWQVPLFFHCMCGALMAVIFFCEPTPGDETPKEKVLVMVGGLWVMLGVAAEFSMRFSQSFELQLLPGGVRLKTLWQDSLLIEPEVVGGRMGLTTNEITLRQGKQRATINLGWFRNRQEQAAIVEHCSQFLSAEQQAKFGRSWATRYHQLLTPRKPTNPLYTCILLALVFGIGAVILVGFIEHCVALGETTGPQGQHLRWAYLGWLIACLFFGGLTMHVHLPVRVKKRQLLISKTASTSTAAPVGNAANPSAERA